MPQMCGAEHDVLVWVVVVDLMRRAVGGGWCGVGGSGVVATGATDRRIMVRCRVV